MPTLNEALTLIRSRAPLQLNAAMAVTDKETGQPKDFRFSDEHEFSITLPAWVFLNQSAAA